jgi:manganese oxidase
MVMGDTGMGDMSEHLQRMAVPRNSIPMRGAPGPFGPIDMGGMFTIVKVRANMDYERDPGWYRQPAGTEARRMS